MDRGGRRHAGLPAGNPLQARPGHDPVSLTGFVSSGLTAELFLEFGDAPLGRLRVLLLTGQFRFGGCQFPGEPLSISCRPLTDGPVIAVRGPYPLTAHYPATLSAFRAVDDAGGNVAVLAMLNVGHHMVATEGEVPSIEVLLAFLP